jgi:RNA polymerase sigma-70 factor (ECF subfamily)
VGDGAALVAVEMFARAHQQTVYRFALSILGDPVEAEDAAQEALVAAVTHLDSYRGEAAFSTWLYAITLNACRKQLQKRQRGERLLAALQGLFRLKGEAHEDRPEEAAIRGEANADVLRAVRGLDEKHLVPIVLRYYHDLPVAEIARILGLSEGTVHSRLYTARERLRLALRPGIGLGHSDGTAPAE